MKVGKTLDLKSFSERNCKECFGRGCMGCSFFGIDSVNGFPCVRSGQIAFMPKGEIGCLSENFNHPKKGREAEEETGRMHKNGKGIWCIKKESCESVSNMENTHCPVFHPIHNRSEAIEMCRDFPERFAEMAALEKEIGGKICSVTKNKVKERIWLHDLPYGIGRYDEEDIECGVLCGATDGA